MNLVVISKHCHVLKSVFGDKVGRGIFEATF